MTQKHNPAKAILLAVVLVLGMIVSPVCAESAYTLTGYQEFNVFDVQKDLFSNVYNLTFDKSQQDKAITLIHFKVPQEHAVSFTLYYGSGNTASGSASNVWNISIIPPHSTTSTIVFNGETKQYSYVDTNPDYDYYLSGYARDNTNQTGLIVYNAGYGGFDNDLAIFKPVSNPAVNLIYKVVLSCDAPFDVDISYGSKGDVADSVSKTAFQTGNDWLNFGLMVGGSILGFVSAAFAWIKFIYMGNLLLVIALWFSVSMAYSATTSKDIWGFYKKFFGLQRSFFTFMFLIWQTVVSIIAQMIQAFLKWL
jgi:hypothetical protein